MNSLYQLLTRLVPVALLIAAPLSIRAQETETPAEDLHSKAYMALINGERSAEAGRPNEAQSYYAQARDLYQQIQKQDPEFKKDIVTYRLRDVEGKLKELEALFKAAGGEDGAYRRRYEKLLAQYEELSTEHATLKEKVESNVARPAEAFEGEQLKLDNMLLKEKVGQLETQLAQAKPALEGRIRALQEQNRRQRSEMIALGKELEEANASGSSHPEAAKQLAEFQAALEKARNDRDAAAEQLQQAKQMLERNQEMARTELGDLQQQLQAAQEALKAAGNGDQERARLQQVAEAAQADTRKAKALASDLKEQLAAIRTEIDATNEALRAEKQQATKLEDAVRDLEASRSAAVAEVEKTAADLSARESRITELETALKDAGKQESRLSKDLKSATGKMEDVSEELADANAENEELDASVKQLKSELSELTDQAKEYVKQLKQWENNALDAAGIKADVRKRLEQTAERNLGLENRVKELSDERQVLRDQIRDLEAGLLATDKKMKSMVAEAKDAAGTVARLEERLTKSESGREAASTSLRDQQRENALLRSAVEKAEEAMNAHTQKHERLISRLERDLAKTEAELEETKGSLATVTAAAQVLKKEVTELSKPTANPLEKELKTARAALEEASESKDKLEQALATKEDAITRMRADQEALLAQVGELKEQLNSSDTDRALSQTREKLDNTLGELAEVKAARKTLEARLSELSEKAEASTQLQKQILSLEKDLAQSAEEQTAAAARAAEARAEAGRLEESLKEARNAAGKPASTGPSNADLKKMQTALDEAKAAREKAAGLESELKAAMADAAEERATAERKMKAMIRILDQKVREHRELQEELKTLKGGTSRLLRATDRVTG